MTRDELAARLLVKLLPNNMPPTELVVLVFDVADAFELERKRRLTEPERLVADECPLIDMGDD